MTSNDLTLMPYYYICKLKDMRDQVRIQLDMCNNKEYRSEFRCILKGLDYMITTFDDIFHGDVLRESLK